MGDVKEFVACVAPELRNLQHTYAILLRDLRAALTDPEPNPSPSLVVTPHPSPNSPTLLARARRSSFSPKKRRDTLATPLPQSSRRGQPDANFSCGHTAPNAKPVCNHTRPPRRQV
ncbi:hypothetical protein JB92DRAFT_1633353 [Gautieria morchelliformis]|nr:hypothetical protein JB92DRAFT_1633353 [Gautieria morchelliformis]